MWLRIEQLPGWMIADCALGSHIGVLLLQIKDYILSLLKIPPGSLVAGEVKYLMSQWAELPKLQYLEQSDVSAAGSKKPA